MPETATPAFREEVYKRAKGQCECTMDCSHHKGKRCTAALRGEWEVHKLSPNQGYALSNVKGLCQTCHRNTPSYGRGAR